MYNITILFKDPKKETTFNMNLNQITIQVLNVELCCEFYKTLGLHLIVNALPRYARFLCPNGDSTFSIHKTENTTGNTTTIYFEVDDIESTYKSLLKKGIVFESSPELKSWLWTEALCKDPNGNAIIIYHAGKNRKNPPWRI